MTFTAIDKVINRMFKFQVNTVTCKVRDEKMPILLNHSLITYLLTRRGICMAGQCGPRRICDLMVRQYEEDLTSTRTIW